MPEGSKDAKVLIDISFQALERAKKVDESIQIFDCTVALVFAGFFIEANLNQIIKVLEKKQEMIAFLNNNQNPGLQGKLAWFYKSYIAEPKLNSEKVEMKDLYDKLRVKFPGFDQIHKFRNDISHGNIDSSVANLVNTEKLRLSAKSIVDELFRIAEQSTGQTIPRTVTQNDAIS
jgi:hypothetical protein